jgi:hypothetical protein
MQLESAHGVIGCSLDEEDWITSMDKPTTSIDPKIIQVVNLVKKVSEMKAPMTVSKKVDPMKLVTVFAAPAELKYDMKNSTKLHMFDTKPMFSIACNTKTKVQALNPPFCLSFHCTAES